MDHIERGLYEIDILDWSEHQADLLRRLASHQINSDQLDWPNIIEEVESVGREQLHAVESLLTQALLHMLKAQAWPTSSAVPGWLAEARLFRRQARRRFTPSMRQRLDLSGLYADALAGLPNSIDGQPPEKLPATCAVTLDGLFGES